MKDKNIKGIRKSINTGNTIKTTLKYKKNIINSYFIYLILNIIFFLITYNFFNSNRNMIMVLFCMIFSFSIVILLLFKIKSYYRKNLIITDKGIEYSPTIGKTETYLYDEIENVEFDYLKKFLKIHLKERNKTIFLNKNFDKISNSLPIFKSYKVKVIEKKNKKFEDKVIKNRCDETNIIREKWNIKDIKREKIFIKRINKILYIITIISFFMGTFIRSIVWSAELIFIWLLYIYLYPKMIVELPKNDKNSKYHYEVPISSGIIALLLLYTSPKLEYINNSEIIFLIVYYLILIFIYLTMLKIKKIKEKKGKMALVILAMSLVIVSTYNHLNNALTFSPKDHEIVTVISKDTSKSSSKGMRHYYFDVIIDGEKKNVNVTSNIYNSIETFPTDVVKCNRESIFGCKYYKIHR